MKIAMLELKVNAFLSNYSRIKIRWNFLKRLRIKGSYILLLLGKIVTLDRIETFIFMTRRKPYCQKNKKILGCRSI